MALTLFLLGFWSGITGAFAAIADLTVPRQSKRQRMVERVVEFSPRPQEGRL